MAAAPRAQLHHISFGIAPWDTDGLKTKLEIRTLESKVDVSTADEIHVVAYNGYHTTTTNGFSLQMSCVTHHSWLTLANAVKPKRSSRGGS